MLCVVARFQDRVCQYPLEREEVCLGSDPAADFHVPFPGVSRRHATVRATGEGALLRDLHSKNKLMVDGHRVTEVELRPGGVVGIGKATLTIESARTSDFELALRFDRGPASVRRSEETRSLTDAASAGPSAALQLVREIESLSRRGFRRAMPAVLDRVRLLIGADSIVVGSRAPDGTATFVAISGPLPAEDLLPATKREGRTPRRSTRAVGMNGIASTQGREWLYASFVAACPRDTWVMDFLDYLASKCFMGDGEALSEVAPLVQLAIPHEMVVGDSPSMRALLREVRATVHGPLDVLLTGETGTGKELFARMIHDSGPTAGGPFIAVNCAAQPADLLESEWFGVQGRVATGVDPRPGRFQQAHGGTMFLDEVGELPLSVQAKLLRVLQEREVLPLGAPAPRKLDFRVIAASNRDLARDVAEGTFRADLFYRLGALHFHLPPLRERREDIAAMVLLFVRMVPKSIAGVSRAALNELLAREWRGNIRELRNEIVRAVLLCGPGEALQRRHLRAESAAVPSAAAAPEASLQERIAALEREAIDTALAAARGNRTRAAKLLGITRNGLAMKMRRLRFP